MDLTGLGSLFSLGESLIEKVWPDPAKQAQELLKLKELEQKGDLAELTAYVKGMQGQLAINAKEAEHPSIFVAGWRPFVGWVGGFSLAYAGILEPFLRFGAKVLFDYTGEFPVIDTTMSMQILLGMLGIGAQRSYDKRNKSNTSRTRK